MLKKLNKKTKILFFILIIFISIFIIFLIYFRILTINQNNFRGIDINYLSYHFQGPKKKLNIQMIASDILCPLTYLDQEEKKIQEHEKLESYIQNPQTIKILQKKGVKYFFPIQYSTFGIIHNGEDLIGRDRTGSGKTIAYSLPIIERFRYQNQFKNPYIKFLVVVPTRELCIQVTNEIESLKLHSK